MSNPNDERSLFVLARNKKFNFFGPEASLVKVQNSLRDLLTLLFTYFRTSLEGDFSWVATYRAHNA